MSTGPDISRIARLIGDPARANMISALMSGQALAAGELARIGGVSAATASSHLAQLLDSGLLAAEKQGRHRYYRIADSEIAEVIESLASLAERAGHTRFQPGPKDPQLRRARICYDHLAGEMGVELYDAMFAAGAFSTSPEGIGLSGQGRALLTELGIDLEAAAQTRRPACRTCLDWSVRRHHLAGWAGAALLERFQTLGWMARIDGERTLRISLAGQREWPRLISRLSEADETSPPARPADCTSERFTPGDAKAPGRE